LFSSLDDLTLTGIDPAQLGMLGAEFSTPTQGAGEPPDPEVDGGHRPRARSSI
jgi:hypothetical protein